ncbi:uncharacterized protein LOC108108459 isoform X1 [Drosophila eugracilis]|uniref:uncharacterized protein LOC108108459 isoform X1 n=1 Tax=Drosophila eugracilis TaxID=29029 RepID=UPI001BDAF092|nr:uncharacterized protein LOC108108459 isoform X1 [Drosophila eugracilis]
MEDERTITDLPVEVLDLIFAYLYLPNKVGLAAAHEKLGKAFAFHSRNQFKKLTYDYRLRTESWLVVIRECGPKIEEFDCCGGGLCWNDSIAQAITEYCCNLESVKILVTTRNRESVNDFLLKMKNSLMSVKLKQHESSSVITLNSVMELPNLKKLAINGDLHENVYNIGKLSGLERLTIEYKYYYTYPTINIITLCDSLCNLRALKLKRITLTLPEEAPTRIWYNLESLKLFQCVFPTELPDCPKLKYLDLYYNKCTDKDQILKFIVKNGKNIDTMYEKCSPTTFDADGLLQLLRNCPKLRFLFTRLEDIKLYLGYVSSMVEILRENGVTREDPLQLVVCRRIKWKWIRRLIPRTSYPELIDLRYFNDGADGS